MSSSSKSVLLICSFSLMSFPVENQNPAQTRKGLIPNDLDQSSVNRSEMQQENLQSQLTPIKLDPEEVPLNWPARKKWSATIVVVLMTVTITFCSSIHAAAIEDVAKSFGCSNTVATLGVTTFLIGFATGPLLFAPLSEIWGRCLVFRITFFLFLCFNVGCALAPNIASLLVFRFLGGFFGSPTVTNSGGCLADIWPQSHRSVPFALFTAGSSLGPVLAPIAGGFIAQCLTTWRWHYWVVTIISAPVFLAMLFLLPETYVTVLIQRKGVKAGIPPVAQNLKEQYSTGLTRPWVMLFTEPILFTLGLYSAFIWGILYLDFTAYPVVFQLSRKWGKGMTGLSFLGIGLGVVIAAACSPWINDIYAVYVKKLGPKPEARLPHLIILAWLIPISLFWFGWTANLPTHWAVCITAGIPFGIGFVTLFLGTNAYLTDCYGRFSASALAANAVMRSLFSAVFPMFARQMYVKLGTPWATSLLGFIALVMTPVPWLLYKYGPRLRAVSKYHLWTVELEASEESV